MTHYRGYTADDLYHAALFELYHELAPPQDSRIEPTKEMLNVTLELTQPRNRLISARDINPAFAFVEVLWIMAGGDNVKYLEFWNKRMKDYAEPRSGLLYGAYGNRLGCKHIWANDPVLCNWDNDDTICNSPYTWDGGDAFNTNQLFQAFKALSANPNSRQVVLQIWDAEFDLPGYGGKPMANDIPCNVSGHLLIRDNRLHWTQFMRSNDAIWGTPYNFIQWTFIQEIMAGWLGIEPGPFVLFADSWHAYQKHWDAIPKILNRGSTTSSLGYMSRFGLPYDEWKDTFQAMITGCYELSICNLGDEAYVLNTKTNNIAPVYMPLMGMLAAEAMRIKAYNLTDEDSRMKWIIQAKDLARLTMNDDLYWYQAYMRWFAAKELGVIL